MWKLAVVALLVGSVAFADKPTVSVGTVQVVVGTFDVAPATKIARTAQAKVLKCYEDHLGGGDGTATAQLKLAVDGKVTSVTVTGLSNIEAAPVHNCIADALGKLKFAAPKAGAVVDLSVAFKFSGGAAVFGSILGDETGEISGGGGFGPGGGGVGWGTIGTGRYGTIGKGGGVGVGVGIGGAGPTVSLGQATQSGDLDKAIIRRYVMRNIQKIQYCYEKELLASPKLQGTVTVKFTIAASGIVIASTASGLNANVESCVAAVVKAIEFPKPKGGEVVVSYPFTFKPAPPAPKKRA